MSWATIEDAIHAFAVSRTGYADGKVIWANQAIDGRKVSRPAVPFVELAIVSDVPHGMDESNHEDRTDDEEDYPEEELRMYVRSIRDFAVEVRVFTNETTGNSTARTLAADMQIATALESVVAAFGVAGFSTYATTGVEVVPDGIRHVAPEGRASFQMRCYTQVEVEEFTTYIESATIEDEIANVDFVVP